MIDKISISLAFLFADKWETKISAKEKKGVVTKGKWNYWSALIASKIYFKQS